MLNKKTNSYKPNFYIIWGLFFVTFILKCSIKLINPKVIFFADGDSLFKEKIDHNKTIIFDKIYKNKKLKKNIPLTFTIQANSDNKKQLIEKWMDKNKITYPLIIKPESGMRHKWIFIVNNKIGLEKVSVNFKSNYIVQKFYNKKFELGVSYTKTKKGNPDLFGVSCKRLIGFELDISKPFQIPNFEFVFEDVTNFFGDKLLNICKLISQEYNTINFRFDAGIDHLSENNLSDMKIYDINMWVFVGIEHSFDKSLFERYKIYNKTWDILLSSGKEVYMNLEKKPSLLEIINHQRKYSKYFKSISKTSLI